MMALIWVSIIIIGIFFLRRNINTIPYFNIQVIFLLYVFCILRICLPFEFSFTKVIKAPFLYNWLFPVLMEDLAFYPISPWELILVICSIISIIMLLVLLYQYYDISKTIQHIICYQEKDIIRNIKARFPEFSSLKHVIVSTKFQTPMQIGFFHPIILLPHVEYSNKDLYYIMKHEMTHYYNHDMWIKLGINIWRCLFWWFPITYLLYYELDESLELKCDYMVIKNMTSSQKKEYLSALLHVYENQTVPLKNSKMFTNKVTTLYKDTKSLVYRFQYITIKKKETKKTIPILITFLVLFLSSYLFIFQAYGQPDYDCDNNIYFTLDNSYIILNDDGCYELYIDNKFSTTLDKKSSSKLIEAGITYIETKGK